METVCSMGTVLVVEDHEDTACLLRFILEREGYGVTHVRDGLMALTLIETTPEWQWIPVILLTGDSRIETMAEATSLGATEYVQKPFAAKRLLKSVHRFLPGPANPQEQ